MKKQALIGSVLSLILLSGCFGHEVKDDIDSTKTNLFVEYFDGGYGKEYLEKAAQKFEEKYKDFKNGDLTGVHVVIRPSRNTGVIIEEQYNAYKNEIIFSEQIINYYDMAKDGKLLDITDIVQENIASQGHSIESALETSSRNFLNLNKDGVDHYYGLPWATSFVGLVYDEEFFFNNGLFFTKDYDDDKSTSDAFIGRIVDNDYKYVTLVNEGGTNYYQTKETSDDPSFYLSKGPDGTYGTGDDGLPATYEDFFKLCAYMKNNKGIYPFTSYGSGGGYIDWFLDQLMTDYLGKEQMEMNFNFTGVAKDLISVSNGIVSPLPDVTLNPNEKGNNLEIVKSAGRYHALKFYEEMLRDSDGRTLDWQHTDMVSNTNQFDAQLHFMESNRSQKKSAFLIDGSWWQNESVNYGNFDTLELYGDKYKVENRHFKLCPFPKATDAKVGEKRTILDTGFQTAFILNKIDASKRDIAKKFLQFCFTDEQNIEFTTLTGTTRPLNYTLTDSDKAKMTCFGNSVWEATKSGNTDVAFPQSKSPYYLAHQTVINPEKFFFTKIDNTEYNNISEVMRINGRSAETAFNGIYSFYSNRY